jgi:hypothetical protein
MTTKSDYTDDEWATLVRAPIVAGMAITIADPGGPIEVAKEVMATLRAATTPSQDAELVTAVSQELTALAKQRQNPAAGFKPKGAMAGEQILDEIRRVNEILNAKASPEEAAAFRAWLLDVAQHAADAAKEGGFMGFGAEQVSAGEQDMLARLGSALGVEAG